MQCTFKYDQSITDMMVIKEQKNKISIDIAQLINDHNLYHLGKDLLTQLKQLSKELISIFK